MYSENYMEVSVLSQTTIKIHFAPCLGSWWPFSAIVLRIEVQYLNSVKSNQVVIYKALLFRFATKLYKWGTQSDTNSLV